MVIFNSYVELPEGKGIPWDPYHQIPQKYSTVSVKSYFNLVAGFNLPLWKIWVKVRWDYEIPNIGKIKFMFQTTNQ